MSKLKVVKVKPVEPVETVSKVELTPDKMAAKLRYDMHKEGHLTKVIALWGNFYRVNYHDMSKEARITESVFVEVVNGEVKRH